VRARIDARLDRPLAAGDVIEADVEVVRERGGFRARVTVWTPAADASRELRAPDCGAIADAVAVVVARAVAEARAVQPAPAPPPAFEVAAVDDEPVAFGIDTEPALTAVVEPRPHVARAAAPRWSVALRTQVGTDAGVVPRIGLSGEVAIVLTRGELAIELEARRWREGLAELTPGSEIGAAIRLDALAGRLCWQRPEVGPRACLLFEGGTMRGQGIGFAEQRSGNAPWSAAGFGLTMRTLIARRTSLVATFEMLRAIDRPRFGLDRGTGLHEPDRLCGRVAAGVELTVF